MIRLRWLLGLAVVAMVVGSEIKAKDLEAVIETNWCVSEKLRDGETCPMQFEVKDPRLKTLEVFFSPYKDHSFLRLLKTLKSPFKVNFKFQGSGEFRLLLVGLDAKNALVGIKEETMDIDRKGGWVLGDQDKRSIWDFSPLQFSYYGSGSLTSTDSEDDESYYDEEDSDYSDSSTEYVPSLPESTLRYNTVPADEYLQYDEPSLPEEDNTSYYDDSDFNIEY